MYKDERYGKCYILSEEKPCKNGNPRYRVFFISDEDEGEEVYTDLSKSDTVFKVKSFEKRRVKILFKGGHGRTYIKRIELADKEKGVMK